MVRLLQNGLPCLRIQHPVQENGFQFRFLLGGSRRIRSLDLGLNISFDVNNPPTYDGILDLAKAVIYRLGTRRGMELDVRSAAPPGSGLGGSSAVTAALIGVVAAYTGQAQTNDLKATLELITTTADRICYVIADKGSSSSAEVKGAVNVELKGLAARLAGAGAQLLRELRFRGWGLGKRTGRCHGNILSSWHYRCEC